MLCHCAIVWILLTEALEACTSMVSYRLRCVRQVGQYLSATLHFEVKSGGTASVEINRSPTLPKQDYSFFSVFILP